ncbi:NAD(P)/FAD-dependent oxidoreductase [Fusobacterium sp.]|uniref:NAD(P)/FAD-dependent oxidoreductase n=1 Tax=Fusobacterium sp. TaxID=68766 RepID=UPI00396CF47F
MKIFDVAIIGAGVIGSSIARELSKYEVSTVLIEAENDVSMVSSKANSAIIHGGYAEAHEKIKGRMCYKGRKEFGHLNSELHFGYRENGSFVIAFEEENLPDLEKLKANGEKNGLEDLSILTKDEIIKMEPNINPEVKYALYCKGAGICSPYEYVIALVENAIKNGVELKLNSRVTDILDTREYFEIITDKNEKIYAKFIVDAAGLEGAKVANMIGDSSFEIYPRSGEYMIFQRGYGEMVKQVVFQMPSKLGKGILVTPTFHNNLLIGPDALNENTVDLNTHVERLARIFNLACNSIPALDINRFIRSFSGVRAVSSTDDFIIKVSDANPRFILATGIQSPGLTSSPAIAKEVVSILGKQGVELKENKKFDPQRKPIIPDPDKKVWLEGKEIKEHVDLPKGNPERFVCRCEQVKEETINEALNRNIPFTTVDGVKRRTRAGMGLCQGGFCKTRVFEYLKEKVKDKADIDTDVERKNLKRVSKPEIIKYLKENR